MFGLIVMLADRIENVTEIVTELIGKDWMLWRAVSFNGGVEMLYPPPAHDDASLGTF
jgi:hypothetical protein